MAVGVTISLIIHHGTVGLSRNICMYTSSVGAQNPINFDVDLDPDPDPGSALGKNGSGSNPDRIRIQIQVISLNLLNFFNKAKF